jgi:HEAT repeat protein
VPASRDPSDQRSPVDRAADVAALGLGERLPRGAIATLESACGDADPRVRAAALSALVRRAAPRRARAAWRRATHDPAAAVRRRAAELAPALEATAAAPVVALLADSDVTVVEAAAWALGELRCPRVDAGAIAALARVASAHDDPVAREAAVGALGALGHPAGLPAVLAACRDKPTVRRRAILALAPFEGPEVEAALDRALADRDWQTRQAAEDLRRGPP